MNLSDKKSPGAPKPDLTRRGFITAAGVIGGSSLLAKAADLSAAEPAATLLATKPFESSPGEALDLAPAKWLWYPCDRTLPNMFVLFRRAVTLAAKPRRATGWIIGDSRYLLEVNGRRIQWGPAPNDPRWPEVDPLDLTETLHDGENAIGATVLFFGHGDGTWPLGRPGFIFRLELEWADGSRELVVSDPSWRCHLSQAWKPGHHRRWFLGALQEEFDARLHPQGWTQPGFVENADWLAPALPACPASQPILCDLSSDTMTTMHGPKPPAYGAAPTSKMELRPRSIPLMRETWVPVVKLTEQHRILWRRPITEFFAVRPPKAFEAERVDFAMAAGDGAWRVELDPQRGTTLTFELPEEVVGWPGVTLDAPEGTTCELMTQEAHVVGGPALLNTTFHKWARFICRRGENRFQWFDFDCLRWIQIHLHPGQGSVLVSRVGILKRTYPWPQEPHVVTSEVALQKVFNAATNTLRNSAQETLVDGMGRERQQYSADCGYQQHAIHLLCGDSRQVARFIRSYSQGLTSDGYFLDAWPAVDRLDRWGQRQVESTHCGAILDCGVQLGFDAWQHYEYTGDLAPLREPYPRLLRFARYLREKIQPDGLLSAEQVDYGFPIVFMDFVGVYLKNHHRQCPFNLKVAAMYSRALAPMARAFGEESVAAELDQIGRGLLKATVARFWSETRGVFVDNLPWEREEGGVRYSDVTLGMAVMADQCPGGNIEPSVAMLAARPKELGTGYPTNVCWRMWALAKGGRPEGILKEFREIWARMDSVRLNNTISENFRVSSDSTAQWTHAACGPIYVAAMSLAGIRPLAPGFARYEIHPQLADLPDLKLTVPTVRGTIEFFAKGPLGERTLVLTVPPGGTGELVLHPDEQLALKSVGPGRFSLPAGQTVTLELKHT